MELIQSKTGGDIVGHIDKSGIITRYDKKANDFAKGRPDRGLYTMFKPKAGLAYYETMKEADLEHGGR